MRGTLSQEQLGILSALQGVAQTYTVRIPKKELKQLLLWVRLNYPFSETRLLFEVGFWQEINRHLYLLATKKDETALKLLSLARIILEGISVQSKRLERQQAVAGPSGAGGGDRGSKQRLAQAPASQGEKALKEREQGIMSLPPIPPPRKPKRSLKRPETPESSGASGSDSGSKQSVLLPEESRFSPHEPQGRGTGGAAESEGGGPRGTRGEGGSAFPRQAWRRQSGLARLRRCRLREGARVRR